ncbi:unnamed protein product [Enterobius vermicularis]|uniref:RNA helicase n=1 Tax=Enterobius vermicularis TaxID=51028 RepID=A0A0N4VJ16_ENTVE|nr:unnamed protein product [Enterobius vermicularis]
MQGVLYPPTIPDDVELSDDSSIAEADEAITVKKKRKEGSVSSDFKSSFIFDEGLDGEVKDELVAVRPYLRKSIISTLQEKIDKERKKLFHLECSDNDDENFMIVQELEDVADSVRDKETRNKDGKKQQPHLFDEETSAHVIAASSSSPIKTFDQLSLSRPLLKAVTSCGFTEPTLIQSACIPVALEGRDICACAATGTGKTAAFMLPILERLLYKPRKKSVTRVLILVPTRELAIQVLQNLYLFY